MLQSEIMVQYRSSSLRQALVLSSIALPSIATAFRVQQSMPSFASSISQTERAILKAEMDGTSIEDTSGGADSLIQEKRDGSNQAKQALFQSFQDWDAATAASAVTVGLQTPTKERTAMVTDMTNTNPTPAPGSTKSFASLAPGIWRVVYAPHIATFGIVVSKLLSAVFSLSPIFARNADTDDDNASFSLGFDPVYYLLRPDGTMTSHARMAVKFPNAKQESVTWFSVAGTYSSQDEDRVCRVDFDEAWIHSSSETNAQRPSELPPYASLEEVPASLGKNVIDALGRFFFIDAVSCFPVSYLDDDCIVFDFELLGTRICAKKVHALLEDEPKSDDTVLQFLAEKEQ